MRYDIRLEHSVLSEIAEGEEILDLLRASAYVEVALRLCADLLEKIIVPVDARIEDRILTCTVFLNLRVGISLRVISRDIRVVVLCLVQRLCIFIGIHILAEEREIGESHIR